VVEVDGAELVVADSPDVVTRAVEVVVGSVVVVVTSPPSEVHAATRTAVASRGRRKARLTSSIVPEELSYPSTVIVPVMFGWMEQK
jgi:hypothetical protein